MIRVALFLRIIMKNNIYRLWNIFAKIFFSPIATVTALLIFHQLTIVGTFYQAGHGIYAAQERFFRSWFFVTAGFIPYPGVKLVSLFLIINLLGGIAKIKRRWQSAGLYVVHAGIVLLLAGMGIRGHFAREAVVQVRSGEPVSSAIDRSKWCIRIAGMHEQAIADTIMLDPHKKEQRITAGGIPFLLRIQMHRMSDQDQPVPCVLVQGSNNTAVTVCGDNRPSMYATGPGDSITFTVFPASIPLPVSLSLINFKKDVYPGSTMARGYESRIQVISEQGSREVTISMNRPYRTGQFTFYQSSFIEGRDDTSILAVVRNTGSIFPYISGFAIAFGMVLHFMVKALLSIRGQRSNNGTDSKRNSRAMPQSAQVRHAR